MESLLLSDLRLLDVSEEDSSNVSDDIVCERKRAMLHNQKVEYN